MSEGHYICGSDTCPWEHPTPDCVRYGSPGNHRTIRLLWWRQQMKAAIQPEDARELPQGEDREGV